MTITDVPALLSAWQQEPHTVSEGEWTPGGEGWDAWNGQSAEREFVDFAAALIALVKPTLVVETGVGQGFTTRRILDALPDGRYLGFESDDSLRAALANLDVWSDRATLAEVPELTADAAHDADVTVLDSAPTSRRMTEIDTWRRHARSGAYLLVHDVRPDHPGGRRNGVHMTLARHTASFGGVLLANPRGGWLCRQP